MGVYPWLAKLRFKETFVLIILKFLSDKKYVKI